MEDNEYKSEIKSSYCNILSNQNCNEAFLIENKKGKLYVCSNCVWGIRQKEIETRSWSKKED